LTLTEGQKLGPYEIIEPAGAGGMGEIFKATDTRLDRTVAIKVLPESMAVNAEFKARFEREAKAISSLNHPNICTLFDIGSVDGVDYLVMEFLEGETLSERLKKGPIELSEAYEIAIEVCDALDKAHRQGLIHRDLKPGNIMLTEEGAKLLDFGLARLKLTDAQGNEISQITQTTPLTGAGAIVGTLQYMAPEQLEGVEADARSDIFSFGVVLYEMLTGLKAFEGKSQASLIAGIMGMEPPAVSEIKPMTPPGLSRLVKKCIEKQPDSRWQSARDLADELRWISRSGSQAGIPAPVSSHRKFRMRAGWTVAVVASAIAVVLAGMMFMAEKPTPQLIRFQILGSEGLSNINWPTISPDGKSMAFRATDSTGTRSFYVRPLSSLKAYPLQGTERAGRVFWSPDSKYLAYFIDNQLMKVPVSGGPAQLVCEANGVDGCWGRSGIILFDGGTGDSIRQVSSSGGVATAATTIDHTRGETTHAWPWFLPDGKHFLYTAFTDSSSGSAWGNLVLKVGSITGEVDKVLRNVETRIVYSAATNHVLFVRHGTLLAQRFDPDKLEFTGEPVPVTQNVVTFASRAYIGVSDNAVLIYREGTPGVNSELVWVNRKGNEIEKVGEPGSYSFPALSPDGERLVYGLVDEETDQRDLWIRDLKRNVSSRLTFDPGDDGWPVWSPDGSRIYYANQYSGHRRVMEVMANGLSEPRVVLGSGVSSYYPTSVSKDGQTLYLDHWTGPSSDIWKMNPNDSSTAVEAIATAHDEQGAQLSPDGKYLIYAGNETGDYEIYLWKLADGGGKWQVSTGGGFVPHWSDDGKEVFFRRPSNDFMAVAINTSGKVPDIGQPEILFNRGWLYDVSSDGKRFIFATPLTDRPSSRFVVVLNWNEELEAR
jgi:serine/threonine protein kinase